MEPIAIIGAGMRLPGGVSDLESFAALLFGKVDAVGEIPAERWPLADFHDSDIAAPGKSRARHAALLDRLDLFDAEFFGIAPREAERLDPVHRLVLEVAWEAIEHAGIDPQSLAGTMTGVYMGLGPSDYGHDLLRDTAALDPYTATGVAYGTAVGRLSYFLDLIGPAIALDTGCSGSLISVHMAAQALRLGECAMALAGGANLILSPELGIIYSKARMLAPDGRCRTFSADAQGFVRGEGCGIVVLRRLSDAIARGDRILGVIRGSATNQDGRSAGLTAPRGSSQEAVMVAAFQAANIDPRDIDFVEAHGTGTPLGDPVEVASLGAVFCRDRPAERPLLIGAVKTNIGHLESGAGIAGLLKLLVAFAADAIPPNLHFAEPNPFIAWDKLAVAVPVEAVPWPRGTRPRFAAVSAFGFGGSNVHMVLEEPPAPAEPPVQAQSEWILPLSARSPKALADLVQGYLKVLETAPLASVCHTAATGRTHFGCRIAVVGRTASEIAVRLQRAVAGAAFEDVHSPLDDLARAYVAGEAIDWSAVYPETARSPVTMPTYPFERRRHWAPQVRAFARASDAAGTAQPQVQPPMLEALAKAPAARRLDLALGRLRSLFAPIQNWDGVLPLTTEFRAVGIDPMAVEVRALVEDAFGSRLPPTLLLNNRNLGELARFLLARAEAANAATNSSTMKPLAKAAMDDADLKARLSSRLAALR